jgi:pimeloyl-ACP methyl ester carboxylesterase
MVLISATTHFPDEARAIMRRASARTMPQPVLEMYRECATRGDEQAQQLIAQFNALHDDVDDMHFTADRLATIATRTLVVHGDRDAFFAVDIPVSLYRAIPAAALWIIPGGDHVPIFEPAVPFSATALRFLDGSINP